MWDVDYVQFTRLLDEINAVGLTKDQMMALATSMEVKPEEVKQLLNRASARWDDLKPLMIKKTPLTEDQVSEELAENGKIEALVTLDFSEIIGQLEDAAMEGIIDDLAERATGSVPVSNIDHKVLFADNDILYIRVTAKADDLDDDLDDEDVEPAE
jgi:hypothetical protein